MPQVAKVPRGDSPVQREAEAAIRAALEAQLVQGEKFRNS